MMPEHFAVLGIGGVIGVVVHLIASRKTASNRPLWLRLLGIALAFFMGAITLFSVAGIVLMVTLDL